MIDITHIGWAIVIGAIAFTLFAILWNTGVTVVNLFHISAWCIEHGRIGQFWPGVCNSCLHSKAFISGIITLVLATAVFCVITPIVILIKGFRLVF